jgi:hypothetical protein
MNRMAMVWIGASLILGCSNVDDGTQPRQAGDLAAEYETQQQSFDQCLQDFGDCASAAADPLALADCAGELETCLEGGGGSTGGSEDGGSEDSGSEDSGSSDDGGSDSGGSDDGGAPGDCDAILDACLADPTDFDPSCIDDYESCVQDEVDGELDSLCDELEAECESYGIPGFDCADVCP